MDQACERQEQCRDLASDLLNELNTFVEIGERIPELEARRNAIPSIRRMLSLMEEIARYICKHTSTQITGKFALQSERSAANHHILQVICAPASI